MAHPLLDERRQYKNMKSTIHYIRFEVIPPISFGIFVAVEGVVLYGLYLALVTS
jgi:hypothetical protein